MQNCRSLIPLQNSSWYCNCCRTCSSPHWLTWPTTVVEPKEEGESVPTPVIVFNDVIIHFIQRFTLLLYWQNNFENIMPKAFLYLDLHYHGFGRIIDVYKSFLWNLIANVHSKLYAIKPSCEDSSNCEDWFQFFLFICLAIYSSFCIHIGAFLDLLEFS